MEGYSPNKYIYIYVCLCIQYIWEIYLGNLFHRICSKLRFSVLELFLVWWTNKLGVCTTDTLTARYFISCYLSVQFTLREHHSSLA